LAVRILIHGHQVAPSEVRLNNDALDEACKNAVEELRADLPEGFSLISADLARRIISVFILEVGTDDETNLTSNFRKFVVFAGQRAAFDEKVFTHDTTCSGMIRGSKQKDCRTVASELHTPLSPPLQHLLQNF
jgi:hypothetical protein